MASRTRSFARPAALLCAGLGLAGWLLWALILRSAPGQDFMVFHTAARALDAGHAALIYDGEALTRAINESHRAWLAAPLSFHPFLYPPHVLLLFAPLALLPFGAAYALFVLATFAALAWVLARHTGRPRLSLAALALFPQTPFVVFSGQNSFLTAALIVGGVSCLPRRKILAGILLGLVAYKPQLFPLLPLALLAAREWRALAALAATAVAVPALSLLVLGTQPWHDWLGLVLHPGATYANWRAAGRLMGQSVFACATLAGASPALADAAQAAAALLAAAATIWAYARRRDPDGQLAVLLAAILLAAPHVSSQDAVLAACAAILVACRAPQALALFAIVALWAVELADPPFIFRAGVLTPLVLGFFAGATGLLFLKKKKQKDFTPSPCPPPPVRLRINE